MAKPGKRSKVSQKRPSYKKIIKQQESQPENIVDQIAALEALLGGGSDDSKEVVKAKAEPQVDAEEQKRLEDERAARKAELEALEAERAGK